MTGGLVYEAALRAWHAGMCPIPAAHDGTKKPFSLWKQYQTQRPTLEQVNAWFAKGQPGWGVLCGATSGQLEMLELEGRAVIEGMWEEFYKRCDEAGLGELLDRIFDGYAENTPSDGLHLLMRVNGVAHGSLKLARRPRGADVEVLFETRGEGGFTILAPSNGTTHPTGKAWVAIPPGSLDTVALVTAAERDALYDVARTFDEMPEKEVVQPQPAKFRQFTTNGESWMDNLCAQLSHTPWSNLFARYGIHHHHDSGNVSYWTRADKPTKDGWSATTNANGTDRMIVFSTSMPFEAWSGNGPAPSYDRLDVIATYEHHGDRLAAARALRDPHTHPRVPPTNVDGATGEIDTTHLPEEFWASRVMLGHIRQAAHSRSRSGDAYLGAVLARLAAITHPSIRLPALVGATAPLSLFVAQVGPSGGGKSSTVTGATELLPYEGDEVADNMPLGSGEGLIELYYDLVDEVGADGKTRKVKKQTRWGAFVYLDEGQALAELGNRKGSTLLPMLRTAWSGVVLGTSNASSETKRKLKAGSYTLGLVIAFQPSKAAELLADGAGGTPQRFEWMQDIDPSLPDVLPDWPGPLEWKHPPLAGYGHGFTTTLITVPESIAATIKQQAIKLTRGEIKRDELDSHATLAKLKVAGLLAVLDGRTDITEEDWHLAGLFQRTSHRVRANVLAAVAIEQRKAEEYAVARHVGREGAVVEDQVDRSVWRMAKSIGRHVHRAECEGGCKTRCITLACASRDKQLATIASALDKAIEMKFVKVDNGLILPGESRPT